MQLQHDDIKLGLAQAIDQALRKQGVELSSETIYDQIGKAPNIEMGHFAYPCFDLAKQFRKAPPLIAKELSAQIEPDRLIASVEAAGPYVNFFVNPQAMGDLVALPILDGRFFRKDLTRDTPKMMVEYSQPNTHKELHVGHMRNLSLGDALIRILQYAGNEVISSTFPGDVGTHVAKCLWYIKYHNTDPMPDTEKGAWLGRMYTLGSLKLEDELGSPQEAINRQQLSGILSQLEAEEGEFFDLWKETRQWSIDLFNWVYDWAGVTFDKWYWESEVDVPSVAYAKTLLQRGIAIESQGAIGVDLSEYNLDFCVLIKSDGHGLYATKDLELARRKFEDFHIERSIYVVDVRQSQHFQQVFKVLELAGFEEAEQCYHLAYNFVELPDGPMSSRKGNIIAIMDLIRQMVDRVIGEYLEQYRGDWPDAEIEEVANIITKGAIKYGMVRVDPNKKIVFELENWLNIRGESGPYIQYTYARINSILRNLNDHDLDSADWSLLTEPLELAILVKLADFNNVVALAAEQYKPNHLTRYLYELAQTFNGFYNSHSIKHTESAALKGARLLLSKAVAVCLREGLALLNIPVPERM